MSIQCSITLALVVATTVAAGQVRNVGAQEVFNANAQVKTPNGAAAATLEVHIDRYTPDADRTAVESALKHGGYANFLNALRKERVPVSIYLVNGIKLQGQVDSFDQFVVLLKNSVSQMVYKHAISTVVPARNVRLPSADGTEEEEAPVVAETA